MGIKIPFNRNFDVPYGVIETIEPGIRRITANNPGPFTFRGTGTYILGYGRVAIIDPGPDLSEHVDALIGGLGSERISHILVTHTHNDHSPAAKELKARVSAPTYGFGPHGSGKIKKEAQVEAGGDMDFIPDEIIKDGSIIEGDDWAVSCLHTPWHTSNHTCFSWDSRKILFPGDQVMGWSTSIVSPPDGDMGDYMRSLEKLLLRDDDVYYPAHGPEIRDPKQMVRDFITHRREREDKILACLQSGGKTVKEMVPEVYSDISQELYAAAARSLFATVIYLVEQEKIIPSDSMTIESHYQMRA